MTAAALKRGNRNKAGINAWNIGFSGKAFGGELQEPRRHRMGADKVFSCDYVMLITLRHHEWADEEFYFHIRANKQTNNNLAEAR